MINEHPSLLEEAELSVEEIRSGVSSACLSTSQTDVDQEVFLDIATLEGDSFKICLTRQGYRVVSGVDGDSSFEGGAADTRSNLGPCETLPTLMDQLSPLYRSSFGNTLMKRLLELQNR